jgi:hypothetical protein
MMDNTLRFEFTIDQTNTIIEALTRMPYGQVAKLIEEFQKQAQGQISDGTRTMPPPPSANRG